MVKVNSNGRHQERSFFLFDNLLVYCKKDMLGRDFIVFKGRINTNQCTLCPIPDGKGTNCACALELTMLNFKGICVCV